MYSLLMFCLVAASAAAASDEPIEVDQALVTLIEQVDVPAREAGVLATVNVREGQLVAVNDPLANLDDTQAQLAKKKAEIDAMSRAARPRTTSTSASPRNRPK